MNDLEKELEKQVPMKNMLMGVVIAFAIGIYMGQMGILNIIPNNETASIIELPTFAVIGDRVTVECGSDVINSKCGARGYIKEGYKTPFMIEWDTGATSHLCDPVKVLRNTTEQNVNFGVLAFKDVAQAECII